MEVCIVKQWGQGLPPETTVHKSSDLTLVGIPPCMSIITPAKVGKQHIAAQATTVLWLTQLFLITGISIWFMWVLFVLLIWLWYLKHESQLQLLWTEHVQSQVCFFPSSPSSTSIFIKPFWKIVREERYHKTASVVIFSFYYNSQGVCECVSRIGHRRP